MTPISAPEVVWEVRDNIMHFVSAVHILLIPTQVRVVVKNQEKLSEPLNVVWEEFPQFIQQWLGDYSPGLSPGASPSPGAVPGPGASLRASPTPSSVPWQ